MNKLIRIVVGASLLASTVSVSFAKSGVAAVDVAWVKAMKAGDVSAVVNCYANDALLWTGGAPLAKGASEIRAQYEGMFAAFTIKDASLIEVGSKSVGDESVSWGRFVLSLAPKAGGATMTATGRYTVVAKRIGGKWVYTVDHASNDPTPSVPK